MPLYIVLKLYAQFGVSLSQHTREKRPPILLVQLRHKPPGGWGTRSGIYVYML